jgi:hypothetical protein
MRYTAGVIPATAWSAAKVTAIITFWPPCSGVPCESGSTATRRIDPRLVPHHTASTETHYPSQDENCSPTRDDIRRSAAPSTFAQLRVGATRKATLLPKVLAGLCSPWEISQKHCCFPRITHALWHLSAVINLPVYVDRPATLSASPTSISLGRKINRCRPSHRLAITKGKRRSVLLVIVLTTVPHVPHEEASKHQIVKTPAMAICRVFPRCSINEIFPVYR